MISVNVPGYWILVAGCWILDAGYWMLGCWMPSRNRVHRTRTDHRSNGVLE